MNISENIGVFIPFWHANDTEINELRRLKDTTIETEV